MVWSSLSHCVSSSRALAACACGVRGRAGGGNVLRLQRCRCAVCAGARHGVLMAPVPCAVWPGSVRLCGARVHHLSRSAAPATPRQAARARAAPHPPTQHTTPQTARFLVKALVAAQAGGGSQAAQQQGLTGSVAYLAQLRQELGAKCSARGADCWADPGVLRRVPVVSDARRPPDARWLRRREWVCQTAHPSANTPTHTATATQPPAHLQNTHTPSASAGAGRAAAARRAAACARRAGAAGRVRRRQCATQV
jgi:hypothetical protein